MHEMFVDESFSRRYIMVAARVSSTNKPAIRKTLSALRLPSQSRIHFVDERDARRRQILTTLIALETRVSIFESHSQHNKTAREECLRAVMQHASGTGISRITFERDDSSFVFDERILYREKMKQPVNRRVAFEHATSRSEPLLWIADAIAWSYTKGGDWRRRISPLIHNVMVAP